MIDLKEFMDGHKKTEVVCGEKKWVFREPTIQELLEINSNESVEKLIRGIIVEGTLEDLDIELNKLTKSAKQEFMTQILQELGLVGKETTAETESMTSK